MTPTNVEKRKNSNESEEGPHLYMEFKRQKTADLDQGAATILGCIKDMKDGPVNSELQVHNETTIGANELASAFALASLASMSPTRKTDTDSMVTSNVSEFGYESRDADNDLCNELLVDQQYHTAVPISPDIRTPIRNGGTPLQQRRRVTFSNDTKVTSRQTSRRLSLPPRVRNSSNSKHQQQQILARQSPGYMAHRNIYLSPNQQHSPRQQQQRASPQQLWIRQHQQLQFQNQFRTHPPASLLLPHLQHQRQQPSSSNNNNPSGDNKIHRQTWICDFCNVASFETYEQACIHEECCSARTSNNCNKNGTGTTATTASHYHGNKNTRTNSSHHALRWPLSPQHSHHPHFGIVGHGLQQPFLTSHCMPTGSSVPPPPPPLQQMHIRRNLSLESASSPQWNESRDVIGGDYKMISPMTSSSSNDITSVHRTISTQESVDMTEGTDGSVTFSPGTDQQSSTIGSNVTEGDSIVSLSDMELVPPYVYFLMRQVESTNFTEADRFVARSKGPVGFAGFQCRHCHGHAGLGKYFPVTAKSLSTNSTSQNIHSHLLKCRKVGPYIKEQLITLKDEKGRSPRLEPGWRRIFFEKIWSRLHD